MNHINIWLILQFYLYFANTSPSSQADYFLPSSLIRPYGNFNRLSLNCSIALHTIALICMHQKVMKQSLNFLNDGDCVCGLTNNKHSYEIFQEKMHLLKKNIQTSPAYQCIFPGGGERGKERRKSLPLVPLAVLLRIALWAGVVSCLSSIRAPTPSWKVKCGFWLLEISNLWSRSKLVK